MAGECLCMTGSQGLAQYSHLAMTQTELTQKSPPKYLTFVEGHISIIV